MWKTVTCSAMRIMMWVFALAYFRTHIKQPMSVLINQFVPSAFYLCFVFTRINFRGMLHHVCDETYDENMCGPI